MLMGIVFGGIAAGPAIASLLIQVTGKTLMPFYVTLGVHATMTLFVAFIMPESLSLERQREARKLHKVRRAEKREEIEDAISQARSKGKTLPSILLIRLNNLLAPITSVFAPLKLLAPRKRSNGALDWSLPALALASALYTMPLVGWYARRNSTSARHSSVCNRIFVLIGQPLSPADLLQRDVC